MMLKEGDVVTVARDLTASELRPGFTDTPADGLRIGALGTVVEVYGDDAYEVEFSDADGAAWYIGPMNGRDLRPVTPIPVLVPVRDKELTPAA